MTSRISDQFLTIHYYTELAQMHIPWEHLISRFSFNYDLLQTARDSASKGS